MKNVFLFLIILLGQKIYGQTTVSKDEFEKSDISVLLTETVESEAGKMAILKFKFIDYSDNKIKFYEAELGKKGFIGYSKFKYGLGAVGSISIMTIPFKIRSKNESGFVTAKADVKNVGLYFPIALWDHRRYWLDNSTTKHKFSIGLLLAPMAQELSDKNTSDFFQNSDISYNSFMLSTSIALTYTYNSLTFAFIPVGFDFAFDDAGKQWDNHSNYWVGFGFGIDTKLFGF